MQKPKVSIIVPVYNVEEYLEKCLNTLVNQTLKDIEIIIVNDGTKDNSQKIIDKFSRKYKKIKAYKKANGGQSSARNYGLKKATGDYIGFIDSDDYVTYDMFEKMYDKAISKNFDVVVCDFEEVYNDKIIRGYSNIQNDIFTKENVKKIMTNIYPSPWNKIYKKELLDNFWFKEGVWFEDVEFLYRLLPNITSIGVVHEPFCKYVQRPRSITKTTDSRIFHYIDNWNGIIDDYKKRNIYYEYYDVLEYSYVRYIYATFIKTATKYDKKTYSEAIDIAIKNVNEHFPKYRKNKLFYKNAKGLYLLVFNRVIAKIYYNMQHKKYEVWNEERKTKKNK